MGGEGFVGWVAACFKNCPGDGSIHGTGVEAGKVEAFSEGSGQRGFA